MRVHSLQVFYPKILFLFLFLFFKGSNVTQGHIRLSVYHIDELINMSNVRDYLFIFQVDVSFKITIEFMMNYY